MANQPDYFTSTPDWETYALTNNCPLPSNPPVVATDPIQPLEFDIPLARFNQALTDAEWSLAHPPSSISYLALNLRIPVRDGVEISVRVLHPSPSRLNLQPKPKLIAGESGEEDGEGKGLPVLFVTHGGGWVQGSHLSEEAWWYWYLGEEVDVVVVSVEYRLAPEHRFPVWIEDSWDVLELLLASDASSSSALQGRGNVFTHLDVNLDLSKVFLAGSSSGAGISAVLSQMCRDRKIPIAGVILNVPVVCDYRHFPPPSPGVVSSYAQAIETYSSGAMVMAWSMILPSPSSGSDPRASPLLGDLRGLPRHLVCVAGQDALRDEGIAYAEKLRGCGVEVELQVFAGVPHHFATIETLFATRKFRGLVRETVKRWVGDV